KAGGGKGPTFWARIKAFLRFLLRPSEVECLQLVDGGVFDNQGIQGLVDQGCSHMLVSDAAQKMPHAPHPSPAMVPVLGRSTSVLMTQVRHHQVTRRVEATWGEEEERFVLVGINPPPRPKAKGEGELKQSEAAVDAREEGQEKAVGNLGVATSTGPS